MGPTAWTLQKNSPSQHELKLTTLTRNATDTAGTTPAHRMSGAAYIARVLAGLRAMFAGDRVVICE